MKYDTKIYTVARPRHATEDPGAGKCCQRMVIDLMVTGNRPTHFRESHWSRARSNTCTATPKDIMRSVNNNDKYDR